MPIYEMGIDISHPLVGAQHVDHVHFDVIPKTSEMDGLVLNIDDNWPVRKLTRRRRSRG